MVEVATRNKPLWFKIIFEMPEYVQESLLNGVFPRTRKKVIDLSTEILVYCGKRRQRLTIFSKWLGDFTLILVEWINNNWKKRQ